MQKYRRHSRPVCDDESVLPLLIDNGEMIYCESIAGRRQYDHDMPRDLSLVRRLADGREIRARYAQVPSEPMTVCESGDRETVHEKFHDRVIMLYWSNAVIEIRPGRCSITSELTAKEAVTVLIEALREDPDYFRSWKDNIAMAFKDEYARRPAGKRSSKQAIHEIANQAAVNFLNLLLRKE